MIDTIFKSMKVSVGQLLGDRESQQDSFDVMKSAGQLPGDRESQQDSFDVVKLPTDERNHDLFIVADGMGGHSGGDIASKTVVKEFSKFLVEAAESPAPMEAALEHANQVLGSASAASAGLQDMGTTLIVAEVTHKAFRWLSVGDSPFYEFKDGQLIQLNEDHSMAAVYERLVEIGELTPEQAAKEPMRHALTSAVQGKDIPKIDYHGELYAMKPGAIYVLASDGLNILPEETVVSILASYDGSDLDPIRDRLLQAVDEFPVTGKDNTTLVLFSMSNQGNFSAKPQGDKGLRKNLVGNVALVCGAFLLGSVVTYTFVCQQSGESCKIPDSATVETGPTTGPMAEVKQSPLSTSADDKHLGTETDSNTPAIGDIESREVSAGPGDRADQNGPVETVKTVLADGDETERSADN